jgi:hypothetical protein
MRKALLYTGVSAVFFLAALVGSSRTAFANCQDLIDGKTYSCQFKDESGGETHSCATAAATSDEGKFELEITGPVVGNTSLCSCLASKNLAHPKFNKSDEFLCGNQQYGDASQGKVSAKGKKIVDGQYLYNTDPAPYSLVFECSVDPSCVP